MFLTLYYMQLFYYFCEALINKFLFCQALSILFKTFGLYHYYCVSAFPLLLRWVMVICRSIAIRRDSLGRFPMVTSVHGFSPTPVTILLPIFMILLPIVMILMPIVTISLMRGWATEAIV